MAPENSNNNEVYAPPVGYPLSSFGPLCFDMSCSEPFAWGFKILTNLGEDRFNSLAKFGELRCLSQGCWALVAKYLTPEKAVEQYGPITHQKFGPQGGWKSVTYGTTTFVARELKPSAELEEKFSFKKEIIPRGGSQSSNNFWLFTKLKDVRKECGHSQARFAELLGVTKKTIVDWEKNT